MTPLAVEGLYFCFFILCSAPDSFGSTILQALVPGMAANCAVWRFAKENFGVIVLICAGVQQMELKVAYQKTRLSSAIDTT